MTFVSITRLRLRSLRFLPGFFYYAMRSAAQAKRARGCLFVDKRKTRGLTFWTLTCWEEEEAMREYRGHGPHRAAMPKLLDWCDEASFAHWQQESAHVSWPEGVEQLKRIGHLSKVRFPSADHRAGRIVTT